MGTGNLLLPLDGLAFIYLTLCFLLSVISFFFAFILCIKTVLSHRLLYCPDGLALNLFPLISDYWYFLFSCLVCVIDILKNSDKLRREIESVSYEYFTRCSSCIVILLNALGWHDECQLLYHKWWSWWNTQSYAACCCTGDSQLDSVNICLSSCS